MLGASTMFAGWGYTDMRNVEIMDFLSNIVLDKIKSDSFFENDGSTTELISLVNSMQKIGYVHDDLLKAVLLNIVANLTSADPSNTKDIKVNWAIILVKSLASMRGVDPGMILDIFMQMADPLHKMLQNSYEDKSKE